MLGRSGARFVVVSLAQEKAERYAADLRHEPSLFAHSPDRLRFADAAHRARYLDACRRFLGSVAEQPSLLTDPYATALLEDTILDGLFLNARVAPSRVRDRSRSIAARQAYRYLQDRVAEVPSIREVCAVTGVSYATLERGFRETYGMIPKAMMTALRLSRVRRTLLHPGPTATVSSVALQCGFVEFGRMSYSYRQRYGETPSETLRRARGECAPRNGSVRS